MTPSSPAERTGDSPGLGDANRLRDLVRAPLRSVIAYDPGPSMAELGARFGVTGLVKLNWNEDLFGLLPGVREAVVKELVRAPLYPSRLTQISVRRSPPGPEPRRVGSCPRTGSSHWSSRS